MDKFHVIGEGPKTFEDWFNVYTEVVDYDGAMKALKFSFEAGVIVGMKENRPRITELEAEKASMELALKLKADEIKDLKAFAEIDRAEVARLREADIDDYDSGLLNDYGGGNVEWWQDYIRAEIGRANEHWRTAINKETEGSDGAP